MESMMKITVLDGYTLNPGDLSWSGFEALGQLAVFDRTPADRILERAGGSDIVVTNKTPLTSETIQSLPGLRYIGVLATGYNVVDIRAARERGVPVTNIPSYGTSSVGQMVFALLLELCHHVQGHSDAVREGRWSTQPDFCFWQYPLLELAGKSMGILGFGRIGRQVGLIASAMGMRVLAYDRFRSEPPAYAGFQWAESMYELFKNSDVISLNCPLTTETEGIINRETIGLMKKTALIINAARGPLINEQDLADALNSGRIAGAGLDVLAKEPPERDHVLIKAENCIITPHIAWATREARERLMGIAVENLRSFLDGHPVNVVNP